MRYKTAYASVIKPLHPVRFYPRRCVIKPLHPVGFYHRRCAIKPLHPVRFYLILHSLAFTDDTMAQRLRVMKFGDAPGNIFFPWSRGNGGTDYFRFKDLHDLIIRSPEELFVDLQHGGPYVQLRFRRSGQEYPGQPSRRVWEGQQLNIDVGVGCLIHLYRNCEATSYEWKEMEYDGKTFVEFHFHFKYVSKRGRVLPRINYKE